MPTPTPSRPRTGRLLVAAVGVWLVAFPLAALGEGRPLDPLEATSASAKGIELPWNAVVAGYCSLTGPRGEPLLVVSANAFNLAANPPAEDSNQSFLAVIDPISGRITSKNESGSGPWSAPLCVEGVQGGRSRIYLAAGIRLLAFSTDAVQEGAYAFGAAAARPLAPLAPRAVPNVTGGVDLIVAGMDGAIRRVDTRGSVRWTAFLTADPIVDRLEVLDVDGDGRLEVLVADGSYFARVLTGPPPSYYFTGNSTFLLDAEDGQELASVSIPGAFPSASKGARIPALQLEGTPAGVRSLFAVNDTGSLFEFSMARGSSTAPSAILASTNQSLYQTCPRAGALEPRLVGAGSGGVRGYLGSNSTWDIPNAKWWIGMRISAFPPYGRPDGCMVLVSQDYLQVVNASSGALVMTLASTLPQLTDDVVLEDADADDWDEVLVSGRVVVNATAIHMWISIYDAVDAKATASVDGGPGEIAVYAGGRIWTRIEGNVSAPGGPLSPAEFSLTLGDAFAAARLSYNLSARAFEAIAGPRGLLVDGPNSSVSSPSPGDVSFRLSFAIPWGYDGSTAGPVALWLQEGGRSPVRVPSTVSFVAYNRATFEPGPHIDGPRGAVEAGAWVGGGDSLSLSAMRVVYAGTNTAVPVPAANWSFDVRPAQNLSAGANSSGVFSARWAVPPSGPPSERAEANVSVALDPAHHVTAQAWYNIDRAPPNVTVTYPAANRTSWFATENVSLAVVVCDGASGVANGSLALVVESGSALSAEIVDAKATPEGCAETLLRVTLPEGVANITVSVADRVGLRGFASPNVSIGVDLAGIEFSSFEPTGWVNTTNLTAAVILVDRGGSGIDLNTARFAVGAGAQGLSGWVGAGLSGVAPTAAIHAELHLATEGRYFLGFSAEDRAGNGPSYSPVYVIGIDTTPPRLLRTGGLEAGVRVNGILEWAVEVDDNLAGIDLANSALVAESETATQRWPLSEALATANATHPGAWTFQGTAQLGGGLTQVSVELRDAARNGAWYGPWPLQRNRPPLVSIQAPAAGSEVKADALVEVRITVMDPDGDPLAIHVYVDGIEVGNATAFTRSFGSGPHTVRAEASDTFEAVNASADFVAVPRDTSTVLVPTDVIFPFVFLGCGAVVAYVIWRRRRR